MSAPLAPDPFSFLIRICNGTQEIAPVIQEIRAGGLTTLDEMATALNRRGYKTARGKA